jgi:uncharacterized membrane protein
MLQLLLPDHYVFLGSRFLLIGMEVLLLLGLSFTTPKGDLERSLSRRVNVLLIIVLAAIANSYALIEIVRQLLQSGHVHDGRGLILSAINIYLTNIIIFAFLYYEMDGGGPIKRLTAQKHEQDFVFPQDQHGDYRHPDWQPLYIDYLYVSSTNGMAFSPTDTMPLSRRAKIVMLVQATISLVTIGLVAARAVNILS